MITTIAALLGVSGKKAKVIAALCAVLLISSAIALALHLYGKGQDRLVETAKDAGAAKVTADNMEETLIRTEQGNEAKNEIRNDVGTARYDQCLRTARTPENCKRFLPEQPAD